MKAYFNLENPPVNVAGLAIGNGVLGSLAAYFALPTVSTSKHQSTFESR